MIVRGLFAAVAVILIAAMSTAATAAPLQSAVGPQIPGPPVVATAAPDPVTAACTWLVKGHSSNCDGLDPNQLYTNAAWPSDCRNTDDLLTRTVESTTMPDGSLVLLTYSGGTDAGCRTVAASLYAPRYRGSAPCSVTLTRSSDQDSSTSRVVYQAGFWSAETLAFYDADVSSYASATCTYGGHTYTGRTSRY
jgi:hypothetical protein